MAFRGHLYLFAGTYTDLVAELHFRTTKLDPPQIPEIRDVAHSVRGIFSHKPTPPNRNSRSHTALPTTIVLPHLTYFALKKRLPVHPSIWSNVPFFGEFVQNSLIFSALSLPTSTGAQKSFSRTTFPTMRSNLHGSALATACSYLECDLRPLHLQNLFSTETFRTRIPQRQGLEST